MSLFDPATGEELTHAAGRVPALRRRAALRRRRRRIPVLTALIVLVGVGAALVATSGRSPAPTQKVEVSPLGPPTRLPSVARPLGAAIPAADVVSLQMFDLSDGTAVAYFPPPPVCPAGCTDSHATGSRDYLVATTDGGSTWHVTGVLPAGIREDLGTGLQMAFRTPVAGYVFSTRLSTTFATGDAGRTWARLATPGRASSISLNGPDLWVVSDVCPTDQAPSRSCATRLFTYPAGQLTPVGDLAVPTAGYLATLLDRVGPGSAVVREGSSDSPSRLVATVDGGRHWTALRDPCTGLIPVGLAASSPDRWVLYCELDGGMNSGRVRLYSTDDGGQRWNLTAESSEQGQGPQVGNIGAGLAGDLTLTGNGRTLLLVGAVAGVDVSTDGGRDWTSVRIQTGGDFFNLATAGTSSAWLPVAFGGLYHTSNGTTWAKL